MLTSNSRVTWLLSSIVVIALSGAVHAGPFDAPFTGTVDINVVGFNFPTVTQGGLGSWGATFVSSTPGTVTIDAARAVTAGNFGLSYRITGSTPLGAVNGVVTRNFELTGLLDNLGGPYTPVFYPLDPTDAVPPSDPVGSGSGDSNFRTTNGATPVANNVTLNAEKLVLISLMSRTPIPGGERFVYLANLNLATHHPAVGNFILGWGGDAVGSTVTIDVTPEPASLGLLALALPLVRRRRVA